jgi:hypothetical protein
MAFVYSHSRNDTGKIFYIGIGSQQDYKRAHIKSNRSVHWHRIVNKVGYSIDILFDNLTWEEACKKEIELIKQYGRVDNNTGILINKTDGGDGTLGCVVTEGRIKIVREKQIGKFISQETREKLRIANTGKKHGPCSEERKIKISQSQIGKIVSPETIKRLSESHKGIKYSKESCIKRSLIHKGRVKSLQERQNISNSLKGKTIPQSVKDKIGAANKGNRHTEEAKKRISEKMKIIRQEQKIAKCQ